MVAVESVVPTFFVASLGRSVDWYERVLGFTRLFLFDDYAGVALGPARIHLAQREPPIKGACYLRLRSGIDEYVAGIEAGGQKLTARLKDHPYGMREATVRDPDGNDIYVGQPLADASPPGTRPS
jgi:catechol 2,3-dioxygenase-like lactoylglutathione lyase family enzyme